MPVTVLILPAGRGFLNVPGRVSVRIRTPGGLGNPAKHYPHLRCRRRLKVAPSPAAKIFEISLDTQRLAR